MYVGRIRITAGIEITTGFNIPAGVEEEELLGIAVVVVLQVIEQPEDPDPLSYAWFVIARQDCIFFVDGASGLKTGGLIAHTVSGEIEKEPLVCTSLIRDSRMVSMIVSFLAASSWTPAMGGVGSRGLVSSVIFSGLTPPFLVSHCTNRQASSTAQLSFGAFVVSLMPITRARPARASPVVGS